MIILETERLILRTWKECDIDPMAVIDQDPKVCEHLPGIGNREATAAGIEKMTQHYQEHGFGFYAIELKSSLELIGFLGIKIPFFESHFTPAVEIGWRLASNHWNQGYATEGAKAVLAYAFDILKLNEVVSFTVVNNKASRRVMEKIGMQYNPTEDFAHPHLAKGHPLKQHVLYRLSKEAFIKNRENES